ncbi:MAG: GNAT family N-acetyltransferase [Rhodobiaceae bacterium]|nr:GNAT family N-acetyltransferase [Rhodobiaceae bacterium]
MASDSMEIDKGNLVNLDNQDHPSFAQGPMSFGRRGDMEVRLAQTMAEIDAVQALRYRVFYEEMSAKADATTLASKRDADRFDGFCDHLLVIDHALIPDGHKGATPLEAVVGCYRLLRQEVAEQHGGFYTASEFNIAPMLKRAGPDVRFLELGRSCVLEPYRNKRTVELLWHGIMHYVAHHKMDVMLGCASFETTDPSALDMPLSYLHYEHMTPENWYVRARDDQYVEMKRLPKDDVEFRKALRAMPPMIKGYIRAGCFIGDGAVVDEQFGTTDVLILFPVAEINDRYSSKFSKKA